MYGILLSNKTRTFTCACIPQKELRSIVSAISRFRSLGICLPLKCVFIVSNDSKSSGLMTIFYIEQFSFNSANHIEFMISDCEKAFYPSILIMNKTMKDLFATMSRYANHFVYEWVLLFCMEMNKKKYDSAGFCVLQSDLRIFAYYQQKITTKHNGISNAKNRFGFFFKTFVNSDRCDIISWKYSDKKKKECPDWRHCFQSHCELSQL